MGMLLLIRKEPHSVTQGIQPEPCHDKLKSPAEGLACTIVFGETNFRGSAPIVSRDISIKCDSKPASTGLLLEWLMCPFSPMPDVVRCARLDASACTVLTPSTNLKTGSVAKCTLDLQAFPA